MRAFLTFLAVGGAILYGLLAFTHNALQDGTSENRIAAETQSNHPATQQLSSWGAYLHDEAPSQNPKIRWQPLSKPLHYPCSRALFKIGS